MTGTVVGVLSFPAGSVAVTLKFCGPPSGKALVGVTDHLPSVPTVVVRVSPVGVLTVILSPEVPEPLIVGVLSLVILSPAAPLSDAGSRAAAGLAGALVSMLTGTVVGALVLPDGSVAVTTKFRGPPSGSATVGVTLQVPSAATVAVSVSPSGVTTVMVSPGVPFPVMVGLLFAVRLSPATPVSDAGAS